MKMSRSAGERRMPASRSRPARRRERGASLGYAIAFQHQKVGGGAPGSFWRCEKMFSRPYLETIYNII